MIWSIEHDPEETHKHRRWGYRILAIVFIVLKLTNVIDWSWWWVLSPLWISALAILAFFGTIALGPPIQQIARINHGIQFENQDHATQPGGLCLAGICQTASQKKPFPN